MRTINFPLSLALVVASLVFAVLLTVPANAREEVDLEIVFAVDASGSVDLDEFQLQIAGYATAFFDPEIQQAIISGPRGKIAAAMVIWSDAGFPKYNTGFYVLDDVASIRNFAATLQAITTLQDARLKISGGGTGIGEGVAYSIDLLRNNDFTGARKVVDVSGDGLETAPWILEARTMPDAKLMAALSGVQINGLPILTDHPFLDQWYLEHVIFGQGSFIVVAKNFADFHRAIREKLWRELQWAISRLGSGTDDLDVALQKRKRLQ